MTEQAYLGIDVGSVSTNVVLMDGKGNVLQKVYLKTAGKPIDAVREAMAQVAAAGGSYQISGVGATGSGRALAAAMIGADLVKNEITAHGVAAHAVCPGVHTVLEIGGQDSKLILLRDGVVCDFAMNTVCAAGTGSFLDRQAERLGLPICEFGTRARQSRSPVSIAGRCAVFAESDMIHKQQNGHAQEDIIAGLCDALARNFLNNLAHGKAIVPPVLFQGGVAANVGMVDAFQRALGLPIEVPVYHDVMGAYGAALLARAQHRKGGAPSSFCGFGSMDRTFATRAERCGDCANRCELVVFLGDGEVLARWGGRCGKHEK